MKHLDMVQQILSLSQAVRSVSTSRAELLARHLELVLSANERLNLTAVRDAQEAVVRHVIDSLSAVDLVEEAPPGELVDLGSGAGFPGIPIAVVLGRPVTLVESVGKKAAFLAQTVESLGLAVTVAPVRAEDWALSRPRSYAVAVARALAGLPSLVELAAPLLLPAGRLIALKGRLAGDELERGLEAAEIVGLRLLEVRCLSVPGADERHAVVFESAGESRTLLPRRAGFAQKKPLA